MGLTPQSRRILKHIYLLGSLLLLAGLLSACAKGAYLTPPLSAPPTISFASPQGTPVPLDTVVEMLQTADYILIGEQHTDALHHIFQAKLLELMAQKGLKPAIGLEMFPDTTQAALDRVNTGQIPFAAFASATDWKNNWGFPFEQYQPIFAVSYAHALPLYALNLPRRVTKAARKTPLEQLTPEEQSHLPRVVIPVPKEQEAYLEAIFKKHMMPKPQAGEASAMQQKPSTTHGKAMLDGFFRVQALWDSTMADRAMRVKAIHKGPVVILAGAGHVEYGWGIPSRIRHLEPHAKLVTFMPQRAYEETSHPVADLIFEVHLAE